MVAAHADGWSVIMPCPQGKKEGARAACIAVDAERGAWALAGDGAGVLERAAAEAIPPFRDDKASDTLALRNAQVRPETVCPRPQTRTPVLPSSPGFPREQTCCLGCCLPGFALIKQAAEAGLAPRMPQAAVWRVHTGLWEQSLESGLRLPHSPTRQEVQQACQCEEVERTVLGKGLRSGCVLQWFAEIMPVTLNITLPGGAQDAEDYSSNYVERDERRLAELGRRAVEMYAVAHIFAELESAYSEAESIKRQDALIREVGLARPACALTRGVPLVCEERLCSCSRPRTVSPADSV